MQAVASRDTGPEKRLRSALHRTGLRFRKDANVVDGIRCKADVVFRRERVCVFVDGCFWHGCRIHFTTPKTNAEWWLEKIQDNRRRDRRKTKRLRKKGWVVVRVWEHDVKNDLILSEVILSIRKAVLERRGSKRTLR